jgi:hypothetical protein
VNAVVLAVGVPVGVLCVVNLAFSLAVIRRLREHSESLAELRRMIVASDSGLAPGTTVPRLAATTEDGVELRSEAWWSGERLVAFVSSSCAACRDHLPEFVAAASQHDRDGAVVVVAGDREQGGDLVRMADGAAHVVVEPDFGPWTTGFDIHTFPTFLRVRDGVVAARGLSASAVVQQLPV